jgi:phytoene synthase
MQQAYAHCEALVRSVDRDRYLATLFVPAARRPSVFAIYAFNAEVASVRERAREPMAGEVRLQWWRDALAGLAAGGTAANPVAAALLDTIERNEISRDGLERLIEARAFDLYDDPIPTVAALDAYLRATTSALFALVERLLLGPGVIPPEAAERAGLAYGAVGLLRAFPLHASRGQIYVPHEILDRFGAGAEDILAGRTTPEILAALRELRTGARRHLNAAREHLRKVPAEALPGFLPLALCDAYLNRMDAADYDPFRTPVDVPQWRRQWRLWRAARGLSP